MHQPLSACKLANFYEIPIRNKNLKKEISRATSDLLSESLKSKTKIFLSHLLY